MNEDIQNAIDLLEKAKMADAKAAPELIHDAIKVLLKAIMASHGSGSTEDHTN